MGSYETLSSETKRAEYDLGVQMAEIRRRASRDASYAYRGSEAFDGAARDPFGSDVHDENYWTNFYQSGAREASKEFEGAFGHGRSRDSRPPPFEHRWSREPGEW